MEERQMYQMAIVDEKMAWQPICSVCHEPITKDPVKAVWYDPKMGEATTVYVHLECYVRHVMPITLE